MLPVGWSALADASRRPAPHLQSVTPERVRQGGSYGNDSEQETRASPNPRNVVASMRLKRILPILLVLVGVSLLVRSTLCSLKDAVLREQCASNLKNIA